MGRRGCVILLAECGCERTDTLGSKVSTLAGRFTPTHHESSRLVDERPLETTTRPRLARLYKPAMGRSLQNTCDRCVRGEDS